MRRLALLLVLTSGCTALRDFDDWTFGDASAIDDLAVPTPRDLSVVGADGALPPDQGPSGDLTPPPRLLNLDFGKGGTACSNVMNAKTGAAAIGGPADAWNNFRCSNPPDCQSGTLVLCGPAPALDGIAVWSDGTPLTPNLSVTTDLYGSYGFTTAGGNDLADLMQDDYAWTSATSASMTLGNLPDGTYTVYAYGHVCNAGGCYGTEFIQGSLVQDTLAKFEGSGFVEGIHYVVFPDLVVSGGTLTLSFAPGQNSTMIQVNGLQLLKTR